MPVGWWVIDPPNYSSLASTLKPTKAALLGELPVSGAIAMTLPKLTDAFVGAAPVVGPITSTLKPTVANLVGNQTLSSAFASVLKPTTCAMIAAQINAGTIASVLPKHVTSFVGNTQNLGQIASTMKPTVANLAGAQEQSGSISSTLKATQASFTESFVGGAVTSILKPTVDSFVGAQTLSGTQASVLAKVIDSFVGGVGQSGAIISTLAKSIAALSASQAQSGSIASLLAKHQASFAGAHTQSGGVASTLKKHVASFAGSVATSTPVAYTGKDTLFVPNINPSTSLVYSANLTIPSGTGAVVISLEGTNLSGGLVSDSIAATINGVAMTLISKVDGSGVNFTAALGMIAPPSGTQPLVITFSGPNSTFRQMVGNTYYFTGGSGFGTPTTIVNNSNTSPQTLTGPTGVTSSDMVHCVVGSYNSGAYVASSHTLLDNSSSGGFYSNIATMNAAGANSIAFSATPNVASPYAAIAFAIKA